MIAKCGHCGGTGTKVAEIAPLGGAYKQTAICCSACSAILGVTGYFDTGALLKQQEAKINALTSALGSISHDLDTIRQSLQRLAQSIR